MWVRAKSFPAVAYIRFRAHISLLILHNSHTLNTGTIYLFLPTFRRCSLSWHECEKNKEKTLLEHEYFCSLLCFHLVNVSWMETIPLLWMTTRNGVLLGDAHSPWIKLAPKDSLRDRSSSQVTRNYSLVDCLNKFFLFNRNVYSVQLKSFPFKWRDFVCLVSKPE